MSLQPVYAAATDLTITSWGVALAPGNIGASAIETNASNLYFDVMVGGILEIGASTPAAGDTLDIHAYAIYDELVSSALTGGIDTVFTGTDTEEIDGTGIQLETIPLLISVPAESSIGVHWGPFSIRRAFGQMPIKWGLLLHNDGNATMAAGSIASYIGINYQDV